MKCERVRLQVTALADGELRSRTAARVRAHLANCTLCAAFYEDLGQSRARQRDRLRSLAVRDVDAQIALRQVLARLEDQGGGRRRWMSRPVLLGAAVGAALIAVLMVRGSTLLVTLGVLRPPRPVAENPELFRDYGLFERLEAIERFEQFSTNGPAGESAPENRRG